MKYFSVVDVNEYCFTPAVEQGELVLTPGGCTECSTLPHGARPPETLRVLNHRSNAILAYTCWGFGIISDQLLQLLSGHWQNDLFVGTLCDGHGRVIDGLHTYLARERVILRGGEQSQHHLCGVCGALIYTYLPRNSSPYVAPEQVATARGIYEGNHSELVISQSLREQIGDRWSNQIRFCEVRVSEPCDGLPATIGDWLSPEVRASYHSNEA